MIAPQGKAIPEIWENQQESPGSHGAKIAIESRDLSVTYYPDCLWC